VRGYGDRCFAAAGPNLWNSLALQLQETDNFSLTVLKLELRRFYFR